jgi:hypothetical protein
MQAGRVLAGVGGLRERITRLRTRTLGCVKSNNGWRPSVSGSALRTSGCGPSGRAPGDQRAAAGLPGGPAGRAGVDTQRGGGRAWRCAQHRAAPAGPRRCAAGGAGQAAARRCPGGQRTPNAGARTLSAAPGAPGRAWLRRGGRLSVGSACQAGLVGAAALRRAGRWPCVDGQAAPSARAARLTDRSRPAPGWLPWIEPACALPS